VFNPYGSSIEKILQLIVRRRTVESADSIVKRIEAGVVVFLGVDWFSPPAQSPLQETGVTNAVVPQVKDLGSRVGTITGIPAAPCLYDNESIPTPAPVPTILGNIYTPNKEGVKVVLRVIRIIPNSFFVRGPLDQFKECEEVVLCLIGPGAPKLLSQGRWKFDGGP
jgi:hypothetical protein